MEAMSNVLKVNKQETIRNLYERGWSLRRIAEELGINRRTVGRHAVKCTKEATSGSQDDSKCTNEVTPGSEDDSKCTREVTPARRKI